MSKLWQVSEVPQLECRNMPLQKWSAFLTLICRLLQSWHPSLDFLCVLR